MKLSTLTLALEKLDDEMSRENYDKLFDEATGPELKEFIKVAGALTSMLAIWISNCAGGWNLSDDAQAEP